MGTIPEDFTKLSREKYEEDYNQNLDEDLGKEFFLHSRFLLDELLLSGLVLFNEPVSQFVNQVANEIVESNPELNELRFYVLKSNVVNALSTDQGIVLVTTGLLARLKSEAELAFILCHEISHYKAKHVRDLYKKSVALNEEIELMVPGSYDEIVAEINHYSRLNESAADSMGIELLLKTDYNPFAAVSAIEMLLNSNGPFESMAYDTTVLNSGAMVLPGKLFHVFTNHDSLNLDQSVGNGTHPEIEDRIKCVELMLEQQDYKKQNFIVSESKFGQIQTLCKFESINIFLMERQYTEALFHSLAMRVNYPNNRFIDLSVLKSLYGIAKYSNAGKSYPTNGTVSTLKGQEFYSTLSLLLKKLGGVQLTVIAYRHALDLSKKYPDDKTIRIYEMDLKKELAINTVLSNENLYKEPYKYVSEKRMVIIAENIDPNQSQKESFITNNKKDNLDIRKNETFSFDLNKKQDFKFDSRKINLADTITQDTIDTRPDTTWINADNSMDFYKHAFNDLVIEQFISELQNIRNSTDTISIIADAKISKEQQKRRDRFGHHLGIENVILLDPFVEILNLKNKKNYLKSEQQKVSIKKVYAENENLTMGVEVIDSKNFTTDQVDSYNDLATLNQWSYEFFAHEQMDFIPSNQDQIVELTERIGTEYCVYSFIQIRKERRSLDYLHILGITFIPTMPLALLDLAMKRDNLFLATAVINLDTIEMVHLYFLENEVLGGEYIICNYLYDILYQLGPDPKEN